MTALARFVLACYPPSFRSRYGAELAALADDVGPSPRATADLLAGAARAWLRPAFAGGEARRARLQATVATTWVAWCFGVLAVPLVVKATLDPAPDHVPPGVRGALSAATASLAVGGLLVLVGAAVVIGRAVLPAVRARDWGSLRPLQPPFAIAAVEALLLLTINWLRDGRPVITHHASAPVMVLGVVWLAGMVALVATVAAGPAVSLARLRPDVHALRLPALLAVPVAGTLAVSVGCSVAAMAAAGGGSILANRLVADSLLGSCCLAALTALVSAGRGVRGLRRA